jgi:hypothetical protein
MSGSLDKRIADLAVELVGRGSWPAHSLAVAVLERLMAEVIASDPRLALVSGKVVVVETPKRKAKAA